MSTPRKLPDIIDTSFVAAAFGWDAQRARRWLRATQLGEKYGGRWATTPQTLYSKFPKLYAQLMLRLTEQDEAHDDKVCLECIRQGEKLRACQDELRVARSDNAGLRNELADTRRALTKLRAA